MAIYTITIPDWHPVSINRVNYVVRSGWGKMYRPGKALKHADLKTISDFVVLLNKTPRATGRRRVRLIIHSTTGVACDADNYLKTFLDNLQKCGMLLDDKGEWCEQTIPEIRYHCEKKATTIILEDI